MPKQLRLQEKSHQKTCRLLRVLHREAAASEEIQEAAADQEVRVEPAAVLRKPVVKNLSEANETEGLMCLSRATLSWGQP